MSVEELQRVERLTEVLAGRRTVGLGETVLRISERQVHWLMGMVGGGLLKCAKVHRLMLRHQPN